MSDFRFGDDYRLNIDWEHQEPDFCFGWDCIDWDKVEWVEIEGEKYSKNHTCQIEKVKDGLTPDWWHCLACDGYIPAPDEISFCPYCGAKVVDE